jgi:Icc-related predicted phosphoesterase
VSEGNDGRGCVRIAAAGDIHVREANAEQVKEAFHAIAPDVDLILLAGDLTTHGEPGQAAFLADACEGLEPPVVAVLGNHDHHCGRGDELTAALEDGGIRVLDRASEVYEVDGVEVGIVGAKGFVGGFAGSHLPDFGEPLLRQVYRETSDEVEAIREGLVAVAHCPVRIVLLHYAPIDETLAGEPQGIHTFLGSSRLADPIREHEPDLVLHGHAHAGTFEGSIGPTPVRNVSVPVMKRDFWLFELEAEERAAPPIH